MTDPPASRRVLSVALTCYNEGDALRRTHERVTGVLGDLPGIELEMVYVDDGSCDSTLAVLRELQRADRRVRVLSLARNSRKEGAMAAGIDYASGDLVVLMDSDLQEPPEVVLDMLERWRAGADVVYGVRASREHDPAFVRWSAWAYNRLHDWLVGEQRLNRRCDFHLLTREVADVLKAMPEVARVHRSLIASVGFRQESVSFARPGRCSGQSKMRFRLRLRIGRASILAASVRPLRLAWLAGLGACGASLALGGYALGTRLLAEAWPSPWTLVAALAMLFFGTQFLFMGLVGDYVGAVFRQVQGRPLYVVQERLGFGGDGVDATGARPS